MSGDKVGKEVEELPKATVVGNVQLGAQMPNGRTISVSCYLLAEDVEADINTRLDLYQRVIERQRTRAEIPELEAKREMQIQALSDMKKVLDELGAKSRTGGGTGLTSQERMTFNNMKANILKVNEDIKKGEKAIAEARAKCDLEAPAKAASG